MRCSIHQPARRGEASVRIAACGWRVSTHLCVARALRVPNAATLNIATDLRSPAAQLDNPALVANRLACVERRMGAMSDNVNVGINSMNRSMQQLHSFVMQNSAATAHDATAHQRNLESLVERVSATIGALHTGATLSTGVAAAAGQRRTRGASGNRCRQRS